MSVQQARGWCDDCEKNMKIERPGTNHVLHIILSLLTLGLWIPIWSICSIKIGGWRCVQCGSKCRRKLLS